MKKIKTCYIIGAGDFYGMKTLPKSGDLVIAADGGYKWLEGQGIIPDMLIGDFDSLSDTIIVENESLKVIKLSKEKDETDMLAAIEIGLENGCEMFYIYGGTGGRFEHTYANIQCLAFLSANNAKGYIYGKDCVITAIKNECIEFPNTCKGFISVFAYSETTCGVCIKGLKYELENATLTSDYPLGVSNEFIGKNALVSVEEGVLIVIYPI